MTRWTFTSLVLASLMIAGCAKQRRRSRAGQTQATAGRSASGDRVARTTDPGSRYLDDARPVGGIAVETAPLPDRAPLTSYRAPPPTPRPTASPVGTGELPPPLVRILPPPPLPRDP